MASERTMRRAFHAISIAWAALWTSTQAAAEERRPNFVVVLVDDLGWADLACMGSTFHETPHLDRLAARGVRFRQAYSACTVCSPTRAALLTGKHPARLHVTDWIAGHELPLARLSPPDWTRHLPLEEVTLAEALRQAGYATASIGKWHLGGSEYSPEKQGFDLNVAGDGRGQPPGYLAPFGLPRLAEGPKGEFLSDRLTGEAIRFMLANRDRPFLLYLPHYAVHQPIAGKPEVVAKYRAKAQADAPQRNPTYAALLESVDDSVGSLVQALADLGLTENTWIVFASDNGGLVLGETPPTSNAPLRAGKGSPYEGGVRTPFIVAGPAVAARGATNDTPVASYDLFPTLLELAGLDRPDGLDGRSLAPLLAGAGDLERDALYWHYPHYHPGGATPYSAVRAGDWKLIEYHEDDHVELFNLAEDLGETVNLANQLPDRTHELRQKLVVWRASVGAQMPVANDNFDPARESPPPHVVRPARDGSILLAARDSEIHGQTVRYEPQPHKNTVGYWTRQKDWVSWDFVVLAAGEYRVEILQGCGPGSGGSQVEFSAAGQKLPVKVVETKGFQDFLKREIGVFKFDSPGRYRLSATPQTKPGLAVMDLREVRLSPK